LGSFFGVESPKPVCTLSLHPYQIFIICAMGFDQVFEEDVTTFC
jgi:hypothetical protein